jgi:hypothetical protein
VHFKFKSSVLYIAFNCLNTSNCAQLVNKFYDTGINIISSI